MTPPPLVLLAEAHDDGREMYEEYFKYVGARVVTALTGPELLEKAAALQPDVIITSYTLQGIDGPDCCARLKRNPQTASIPIVMITVRVMPREIARARRSGADRVLPEPITPQDVWKNVQELIAKREAS